jgi:tetratricopeptide (TPR) repeat protein
MLVGRARSLAARRRARRAAPDGTELAEAEFPEAEVAEAEVAEAEPEDTADAGGSGQAEDADARVADLTALFEPTGEPPERLRGRDQLLSRLDALVWAPDARTHVLAGPGGGGKTAVALWLAREAARRGVPAWWVPAADAQTVTVRLVELAACVGARPGEVAAAKAGQRGAADLLWRYLEQRAPWLLVIDGADEPDAITSWLRRTQTGLVVVTSRVGDKGGWGRHTEVHEVAALDAAVGGRVLVDLAPGAGPAREAAALSERLGGLPAALRHAGSQLAAGLAAEAAERDTFQAYAVAVDRTHGGGEQDERAVVAVTREIGLEALASAGVPQARAMLRALGFLAAGVVIPGAMLDLAALAGVCDGDAGRAAEGLRALAAAGLITATGDGDGDGDGDGVIVHSAIAEASRVYTGDAARAGGVAVGMLGAAAAGLDVKGAGDWPAWVALQPHVSAVYGYLGGVLGDDDLAALTALEGAAAAAFINAGCTTVAADLATAALRHAQRLGADHPSVLALRGAVARAQSWHENSDGSEADLRDLLAAQSRVLGLEHPDALDTGHQLARLLERQGEYERAEQLLRDLLAARSRNLGPDHPSTLTTWHDLGLVLAQRGQYEQAAREFSELLQARARLLGPGHRDTRVTRRWLAHMAAADATLRSG